MRLDFLPLLRVMAVILHELLFSVLTAAKHQAGKIAQAARPELVCDLTPLHNSFRSPSSLTLHRTSSKEFGGYRQSQGIILCHKTEKWEWTGVQSLDYDKASKIHSYSLQVYEDTILGSFPFFLPVAATASALLCLCYINVSIVRDYGAWSSPSR